MIQNFRRVFLTGLLLILGVQLAIAAEGPGNDSNQIDIQGKLRNEYFLDFSPVFGKIQLPRIIYDNNGLHFFSSTTAAINSNSGLTDEYYEEGHSKIIKNGVIQPVTYELVKDDGGHIIADFSLSVAIVYFMLSGFLVLLVFIYLNKKYSEGVGRETEPKGVLQNMFETIVIFVRDEIALINIGPEKYLKFTPYLLSAFFMILFMNLFELIPWGESPTANLTVTAALATVTFLVTQFNGSKDHWKEVFWFPGVPVFVKPIMAVVEFLGLFTKPFALCIRLFANMASGKVLILSMIGLIFVFANKFGAGMAYGTSPIWIVMTLFIYMIKLLVAFIQAYIFTILSALFIGLATAEHEHHDAEPAHQ